MAMTPEERKAATKAKIKARMRKEAEAERVRKAVAKAPSAKKRAPRKSAAYDPDKSPKFHGDAPDRAAKIGPKDPEKRRLKDHPICGATRSKKNAIDPDNPGVCTQIAGWGTTHPGIGHCKWHGGSSPSGIEFARKEKVLDEYAEFRAEQIVTMGHEIDIDPTMALAQEVRRTAGIVAWCADRVRELEQDEVVAMGPQGPVTNPWVKLYQDERDRLINVSKVAISAGIAERQVRLAESQGQMIAALIQAVILDKSLNLTPEQRHIAKGVVRHHIMKMEAIDVSSSETAKSA